MPAVVLDFERAEEELLLVLRVLGGEDKDGPGFVGQACEVVEIKVLAIAGADRVGGVDDSDARAHFLHDALAALAVDLGVDVAMRGRDALIVAGQRGFDVGGFEWASCFGHGCVPRAGSGVYGGMVVGLCGGMKKPPRIGVRGGWEGL